MKSFVLVVALVALSGAPRLAISQCSPAQFYEPYGWLVGYGYGFEPEHVASLIMEEFTNGGVRVRDCGATYCEDNGIYERYDLYVSQVAYADHPGWWEADLIVYVRDWQGIGFRSAPPPRNIEPCQDGLLVHSKRWHVDSRDLNTSQAIADYYFANRNALPSEFALSVPSLGPLGAALLMILLTASGLLCLGCVRSSTSALRSGGMHLAP